ncbi:MAG: MFS transporter [Alicyclobacillus macrosporangiidus]|uniref:MFS transporter n=1 Tax=Alicyclobacillus macrosporangiidus TaxID=392015 RepID=UPI0026ED8972|nr:MFS transporter [Alicyclobacillus macrosporangiidus]MCL6599477.1 MFS transporter [Alicyclobacillus macrosporangiidus]
MPTSREVNVNDLIDAGRLRGIQLGVILLCGLIATLDGFDLQSISFVAPVLTKLWGIKSAELGPVFSASLAGLMIGALVSGPVADRVGRKAVVVVSVFAFGAFSLLTTLSGNVQELVVYRFLTGVGLGGSMPNVIALTAEYSPERLRRTLITTMWFGVPIGVVAGGLLAAWMIPSFGWKSVFYLGGGVPVVIGLIALFGLPESLRFLVNRGARAERLAAVVKRLNPQLAVTPDTVFVLREQRLAGLPVKHLFGHGYAVNTLLLWVAFFMNLFINYFVTNWMPTVLQKAGLPLSSSIVGLVMLEAGGLIGGVIIGRWGDRSDKNLKNILAWALLLNAVAVVLIRYTHGEASLMMMLFITGLLFVGAQFGMNAVAATIYPTSIRSTGIGWALGVGRVGSIIGPLVGGAIVGFLPNPTEMFAVAAVPSLLGAIALAVMKPERWTAAGAGAAVSR